MVISKCKLKMMIEMVRVFRDAPLYIQLLRYWFGYVPNLVNSVDILAVRHVKQGIEAERFRAVQPLVQV
jgi:plasmid stabilization system protein ParE